MTTMMGGILSNRQERLWELAAASLTVGLAVYSVTGKPETTILLLGLILGIPFFLLVLLPKCMKRPAIWVAVMMLALAIFPNSSVLLEERVEGEGFRLFVRFLGGVVCIWDVLLFILLGLVLYRFRGYRLLRPLEGPDRPYIAILMVWAFALVLGISHATIVPYGPTTLRSVAQQVFPLIYMVASYCLVRAAIVSWNDVKLLTRMLRVCNIMILCFGTIYLALYFAGRFEAILGFLSIPIVLYDQLAFLTIGSYLSFAAIAQGQRVRLIDWIILVGGLIFVVLSSRRLNLVMFLLSLIALWWMTSKDRRGWIVLGRMIVFCVVAIGVLTIIAYMYFPQIGEALILVIMSLDVTSPVGQHYGGALRLAQMENLFRNLSVNAPTSFVWGMGLGTQWYEFIPLGLPMDRGTTAFDATVLETGRQGWWPYFQLPYLAGAYRIGLLGMFILVIASAIWFYRWYGQMRRIPLVYQPCALMIILVGVQYFPAMGDGVDSSFSALFGIWLGVLDTLVRQPTRTETVEAVQR